MDAQELERLFAETLEDGRLSRSERRALKQLFDDLDPAPAERLELLGRAFDVARGDLADQRDREVLNWLEALVKTFYPRAAPEEAEAFFAPHQDCALELRRVLDEAEKSAEICVFTITDNRLTRAILDAHRRGVTVRVISDDDKALDRGSDIYRLIDEGIPVRMDSSDDHMHHKFALIDRRRLVTGSYNWTRSASERNRENIALTDDKRLIGAFGREFDQLWKDFAPE